MCQMQGFLFLRKKHVRPVELWNQNNATFVQINHYQTNINQF